MKRFLRGWIEGIKTAKTDKEYTVNVMRKFLKTSDRSILEKTFEVYKPDSTKEFPRPIQR